MDVGVLSMRYAKALIGYAVDNHVVQVGENINDLIRSYYSEAVNIVSNLPEVTIATGNPDTVVKPQDLDGTDVAVVRGELGVAENGCVWIPQAVKEKAVYFIAEYLVILLSADKIVDNMHVPALHCQLQRFVRCHQVDDRQPEYQQRI